MSDRDPAIEELGRNMQDDLQLRIRTVVPGIVVSYTSATQSATIQPAPRSIDRKGGSTMTALVTEAPVVFPEGGGWSITWPLAPGSRVLMLCSDRGIDRWRQTGSPYIPTDTRKHRLTDAFVWPGAGPAPDPITGLSATNLRIIGPGGIALDISPAGQIALAGGGGGFPGVGLSVARAGDSVSGTAAMNTWMAQVAAALGALGAPPVPPTPPTFGTISTGSALVSCG